MEAPCKGRGINPTPVEGIWEERKRAKWGINSAMDEKIPTNN